MIYRLGIVCPRPFHLLPSRRCPVGRLFPHFFELQTRGQGNREHQFEPYRDRTAWTALELSDYHQFRPTSFRNWRER